MPQFLIIAHDGTDAGAAGRRQAVRPAHLASIEPRVAAGEIIVGGAILNDAGTVIGSVVLAEFASRAVLDAWLEQDPYVTGKVWQQIEVQPIRIAVRAKV
jgi:uncharacterized protein YciI